MLNTTLKQRDAVDVVLEINISGDAWCRVASAGAAEPLGYVLCFNLEEGHFAQRNGGLNAPVAAAQLRSPASSGILTNNDTGRRLNVEEPKKTITTPVSTPTAAPAPAPIIPGPFVHPNGLLSDSEVQAAIAGRGRDHWVQILDMGLGAAGGNQWPSISLYMPEAVLAIQAQSARSQFTGYEPSEEEKRRSLMIVAEGWAGKTITEGCTSVTRIVLLSERSGGMVLEAYQSQPLPQTWRNSFGATNQCQALQAKFLLDEVYRVKAAAPNGKFFVAVFAGTVNTKMYKVKTKYQRRLSW
jgi:hypothetical protein